MRHPWLTIGALSLALATPVTLDTRQHDVAAPQPVHAVTTTTPPATAAGYRRTGARDLFTFVVGDVMSAPRVVRGADARRHLAYEVMLLNTGFIPVTVRRLDTLDARTGAVLSGGAVPR